MRHSLSSLMALAFAPLASAVCAAADVINGLVRRDTYLTAPPLEAFNEVRRRDLLEGQMPQQAAPTQKATRTTRDQRPGLRHFLLPRNDFAF